jgi:hypothetical protein
MEGLTRTSETYDGITREVSVEKIENGFIVNIHKYGSKTKGDCKDCSEEWIDEVRRFFSKTNPLENMKEESKEERQEEMSREDIFSLIDMM